MNLTQKVLKIGVITVARSDYWIYYPLLKKLQSNSDVELIIFALGMHTSPIFGETYKDIISHGFNVVYSEDTLNNGDSPTGISKSIGETTIKMALLFDANPVDFILCLGDRFEMFAAVSAIIPYNIPIGHLHGGEVTEGAIDEKFRHAITKLSDYHFTSCEEYKKRVLQMGADPQKVYNVGSLGIENLKKTHFLSAEEIQEKFSITLNKPTIIGTYHSVTTEYQNAEYYIDEFIKYLLSSEYQCIVTLGNADTAGVIIREKIIEVSQKYPEKIQAFENLGAQGYFSVMKFCDFVIGNSSSGIIEAASLNKPVINIGNRQKRRACSENVIHCEASYESISNAAEKAKSLIGKNFINIYEQDHTSQQIHDLITGPNLETVFTFNDII